MPPPSPSFPISDSRGARDYRVRLPAPSSSLPPPSALHPLGFASPSPTVYSPGPLPSPRYLESFPDPVSSKFPIGVYSNGSYYGSSITTPPLTPGFASDSLPASPMTLDRRNSILGPEIRRNISKALPVAQMCTPAHDSDSSNSDSSASSSPTFESRGYWDNSSGASSPNTSPSESRRTSEDYQEARKGRDVSVSSNTSLSSNECEEKDDRVEMHERQQFVGMKRRRIPDFDEEEVEAKRRRESSASIVPGHHRSLSMRSESAPPSDGEDGESDRETEEYDVLGRKKPKTPRTPVSWDPEDDRKLIHLKEVQKLGWKQISTYFKKRTSHACQFRWRRLTSGTLKYYQGQRRPPIIPPMTPPEYNSPSPKQLPINPIPVGVGMVKTHARRPTLPITPPAGPSHMQPSSPGYFSMPLAQAPAPWTPSEDQFLLDKKRTFAEVNVILSHRSESEIWQRMGELRYGLRSMPTPSASSDEDGRRSSVEA